MQIRNVTTPFGRRAMTLGMLATQYIAADIEPRRTVDKWKLFRALCEAKPLLGVTDRALAVLNALLSFHPGNELSAENGLIVFPSNAQLSIRAHGMAPATLRRHLSVLVEAGLLIRKDSPNGKRYARRDRDGDINQAFGFDLAPLLSRSVEIQSMAAEVAAERDLLRATREHLSLCRRDVSKLIETALEERVPGDWLMIHEHFRHLVLRIPRLPCVAEITPILDEMQMLREEVLNLLETRVNIKNIDANESQTERHIQNSKTESNYESEPSLETKQGGKLNAGLQPSIPAVKAFPLGLVLKACPDVALYGPGGAIGDWRDLMSAAVVVRSMLGVSPSAYQHACEVMGPENTAVAMACILERGGLINSAGGYLRDLTKRAEKGEFSLGPMLMALMRFNGSGLSVAS